MSWNILTNIGNQFDKRGLLDISKPNKNTMRKSEIAMILRALMDLLNFDENRQAIFCSMIFQVYGPSNFS